MQNKPYLTLDDVKRIAAAAEAEALANKWAVCIAIVDDGGHLLWLQRLDGTAPMHCPSTSTGTPPSSMPASGALRNALRPWLIMSS